jgi:preprotein translocase subunit YajC
VTNFLAGLAQAAQGQSSPFVSMFPILLVVLIMYFIVFRPQAKKQKELQKTLSELKKGDEVVTTGGLIGKISGMKDTELTLQLQEGVRVRVLRNSVTGLYTGSAAAKTESKAEAKAS